MIDAKYLGAVEDFRRARRKAALEEIFARLTGKPTELMRFDEVRKTVGQRARLDRGLQEIPVAAIVGSVGRYGDFTRSFFPRYDAMEQRWARVKTVATGAAGWDPIEVYQLGDVYFVLDGNHRVSVARQMGLETIPAYVTEIKTNVPLAAADSPDEIIIKARHAEFLESTGLDQSRPDAELLVTAPGAYRTLADHIQVHRYYMGLEQQRDIAYEEAAEHWYDAVYEPVATIIREYGLLFDFPDRTETDLYLWLAEHRAELEKELGWEIRSDYAAEDLSTQKGKRSQSVLTKVGERVRAAVWPDELEPGPPPGIWRTRRLATAQDDHLFADVMVAINGDESGWPALATAIVVAGKEQASLRGLHIVPAGRASTDEAVAALRERFHQQLGEAGISGDFVVESGIVPRVICDRGRWNDLVVLPVNYPPSKQPLAALSSGIRQIIARCARPVLAVPAYSPLQKAMLVYDSTSEADEALFIATYLSARWQIGLVVAILSANEDAAAHALPATQAYLQEHGADGEVEVVAGSATVEEVLAVGEAHGCDFLIVGGYGQQPVAELFAGSLLSDILRHADYPVLIAR